MEMLQRVFPPGTVITEDIGGKQPNALRYLALPRKNGAFRWMIPEHPAYGLPVLREWQPYAWRSRLQWSLVKQAYTYRLLHHLPAIPKVQATQPQDWSHLGWQQSTPPVPVIYVGTESNLQRLVVFLIDVKTCRPTVVAKIPCGADATEGILREAECLARLTELKPGIAPVPLFCNAAVGIATQAFMTGRPTHLALTPSHIRWLVDLALPGETICLQDEIAVRVATSKHLSLDAHQQSLCQQVLQCLQHIPPLPAVVVHGDFAPWNLKWHPTQQTMIGLDWENARIPGPPLYDLVHFHFMQAMLFQGNKTLIPCLMQNPLIQDYLRALNLSETLLQPLMLFYFWEGWLNRRCDGMMDQANAYLKALIDCLERMS